MKILVAILSLFVFLKTLYYGIYEFKQNNNRISGVSIIVIATICLIVPNILVNLRIDLSK